MTDDPQMMIAYCRCGDRIIALDIACDRYFSLPASAVQLDCGSDVDPDKLARHPAFRDAATAGAIQAPGPAHVAAEEYPGVAARFYRHWLLTALALATELYASYHLKRTSFALVIDEERRRRPGRWPKIFRPGLDVLKVVFERTLPVLGRNGRCLPRSIAFKMLASRFGYAPRLVIGVKADPFAAHCWVECETFIMNDTFEYVRPYTPIYAT